MSNKKALSKKKDQSIRLTPKNINFLQHLIDGKKTFEAYKLAGYRGGLQASYELRSSLRKHLAQMLENEGFSREYLKSDLLKLLSLPCVDGKTGEPLQQLTFNQKMQVLEHVEKLLANETERNTPQITPFVINMFKDSPKSDMGQGGSKVIDITPLSVVNQDKQG